MAGILNEYISRKLSFKGLMDELDRLILAYNRHTGRYLFIYTADFNKAKQGIPDISMDQDDFYNIQDTLRESSEKKIYVYIETPGGRGEAAEEIARFLHKKFDEVNFVIASEAKSAGTILVLSGDNIYMTETGSIGPIDAQTRIGRSFQSAYDYKEWIELKRAEVLKTRFLNPVDAQIIAQITPGELAGVTNALEFAKDLVSGWLVQYKFRNWTVRESTQEPVSEEYKVRRAKEVAETLCNHSLWRSHGRSIKIEDLKDLLLIERIENDPLLSDIVYRIKIILKLIFGSTSMYKIYKTADTFLNKAALISSGANKLPQFVEQKNDVQAIQFNIKCMKCGKIHSVMGYLGISKDVAQKMGLKFNPNVNENNMLVCDHCKTSNDLNPILRQLEQREKKSVIVK